MSNKRASQQAKMMKCKSLESFNPPARTDRSANSIATRPKFQTIRPRFLEIDSESNQDHAQGVRSPLARVNSVDQLSRMRETVNYENIVELYRKENENLKQQNKYLLKEIKKRKKNEEALSNYIEQLRKQIKMTQRNRASSPPISPINRSKILSNTKVSKHEGERAYHHEMAYEKTGEEGDTWNTMYEIEELNERFNILMDQCSKETCRRTRNLIRGKLAETAQKMRNFKKEFNLEN